MKHLGETTHSVRRDTPITAVHATTALHLPHSFDASRSHRNNRNCFRVSTSPFSNASGPDQIEAAFVTHLACDSEPEAIYSDYLHFGVQLSLTCNFRQLKASLPRNTELTPAVTKGRMGSSRRMIRQSRAIKAEPQVLIEVAGPASRDHGRPSIMAESPWNLQAPAQPHVGQWPSIQCEMPVNAVGTPETDVSVLSGLSSTRESRKSLASTGFTTPDVLLDTEMSNLQSSQAGSRFNRKRESLSQLELDKKLAHQLQQEEDSIENLANQGHMMYTSDALLDYQAQLCRLEEKNRHRLGLKRAADSPDRPSKRKKPDVKSESLSKDQLGVETVDLIEDGDVRSCECSPGTSDDDIPLQGKRRRGKQVARKSTASRKTIASRKTVASRVKVEPTIKPEPGTCLSSEGLKISTLATPAESLIPSLGYGGNGEMYGDSEDSSRDLLSDEFSSVDGDGCVLGTHESLQEQNFRKNHPGLVNAWTTLETIPLTPKKKAEQPRGIVTRTLKDFQLEGLNWMLEQEKGPFRGGLLGDEMGMGKTIQAVSLLVSDHDPKLRRKPSLVVVPPVALMQWKNEISLYTDNALKIFVWHGMGGKMSNIKRAELLKHDIILITCKSLCTLPSRSP